MFVPKQGLGTSSVVISIPYVPCQGGLRPSPFLNATALPGAHDLRQGGNRTPGGGNQASSGDGRRNGRTCRS